MDIVDVQPSFITARKKDREIIFRLCVLDYYRDGSDYFIDVPATELPGFTIIFFKNKSNNNVAMFATEELGQGKKKLTDLKEMIKRKWEWELKETSTT